MSAGPQQVLCLRLGEKHAGFAITNKSGNELYELAYCTADHWGEDALREFLHTYPSIQQSFYEVLVTFEHPQAVLIPGAVYKTDDSRLLLESMHGHLSQANIISEQLAHWQIYNAYALPKELHDWTTRQFPRSRHQHLYSLFVKNMDVSSGDGTIRLDFRTDDFTVMVAKDSRLLLARSFPYAIPEDVIYELLNICRQFGLSQQDTLLQLSGLIDKQSALYKDIYQYFIHVEFREASWHIPGEEYPAHFFTSFNDLARCVS
jgi:hypothetical protein